MGEKYSVLLVYLRLERLHCVGMTLLEEKRNLCEDLEIIEDAITNRFQRNPELYFKGLDKLEQLSKSRVTVASRKVVSNNQVYKSKKVRRSLKQITAQTQEIRLFLDDYYKKQRDISNVDKLIPDGKLQLDIEGHLKNFKKEIDAIQVSGITYSTPIIAKKLEYSMFSAATSKNKPNTILSRRATNLDINEVFGRDEHYGEYLDLEKFHADWLNVVKSNDCTLLQYVKQMECFMDKDQYLRKPPMDRKNHRYMQFIIKFSDYLMEYFHKKYCLIDKTVVQSTLRNEYQEYLNKPLTSGDNGKQFCVACSKNFKVITVFNNHLDGKIHKKAVNKSGKELFAEYKLHRYMLLLKGEFEETKLFIERKLALTADERVEEIKNLNKVYNEPTYLPNETEENETKEENDTDPLEKSLLAGSFNMPLGLDGLPIPYWLYKLQGLDVTYTCEICGHEAFKGRRRFEKHFSEAKHQYHLRCLGIAPSSTFKGITSIQEAQSLWNNIKSRDTTATATVAPAVDQDKTMTVEVEDKEGNVMTEHDYNELKKQGLL